MGHVGRPSMVRNGKQKEPNEGGREENGLSLQA